jgi:23S rRNA (cytosine1962-C5)-methyltransferase
MKHPTILLRSKEGRRVKAGAPWAFSNEIVMDARAKALPPGSLVTLAEADGTPLGRGYFNPKSLIAVRLLAGPNAEIDTEFLAGKLKRALGIRERLLQQPFYRLVHAEGDLFPGVVIDRFGDACVVQITTAGMELLTDALLAVLDRVVAPASVILRNDSPSRALEGLDTHVRVVKGGAGSRLTVEENGVRYFADPTSGQKSGWYYDQRNNRRFVAGLAKGKRVLDTYCYTGGFSILAAVKGAAHVLGLDSSAAALELAAEAAVANGVGAICTFKRTDVLGALEKFALEGEVFEVVIADPPPFVPSRKDVEAGARAYRKLARLAAGVVAPNGFLMLASCSHNISPERFATECALGIVRAGRTARLIREAGAGPDHPIHPMLPETAYLKTLTYAVD